MLHIHFGAGRLGLGLVAPFLRKQDSELYLLNRAVSGSKATGGTSLDPGRRNDLLRDHPERQYFIQKPGGSPEDREVVRYDGFHAYGEDDVEGIVRSILDASTAKRAAVVVTASVLQPENYAAVIRALNALCEAKEGGEDLGPIFLVACENTLTAFEVIEHEDLADLLSPETRRCVVPVHALVDRLCVELEEDRSTDVPTVCVCAEDYGSLKFGLTPESEPLVALCAGSRVEFGRHIDVEKQIKSWLVNGTHCLLALTAFKEEGDAKPDLKLNDYLTSSPEHREFAASAMKEMGEGIAILLHKDPKYADFAREVDVDAYLDGACAKFLERMEGTADPITRILARFRAPTADQASTIETFTRRFADRIDQPIDAYEHEHGHLPPATSKGILNFYRLIASGHFIDTPPAQPA